MWCKYYHYYYSKLIRLDYALYCLLLLCYADSTISMKYPYKFTPARVPMGEHGMRLKDLLCCPNSHIWDTNGLYTVSSNTILSHMNMDLLKRQD